MIIIVSGVLVGVSGFHGNIATNYNLVNVTDSAYMNRTQEVSEKLTDMRDKLEDTTVTGNELLDLPFTVISGAITAIRVSFSFLDIGQGLIIDFAKEIIVPSWVVNLVYGLLGIMIISGMVYLLMKIKW